MSGWNQFFLHASSCTCNKRDFSKISSLSFWFSLPPRAFSCPLCSAGFILHTPLSAHLAHSLSLCSPSLPCFSTLDSTHSLCQHSCRHPADPLPPPRAPPSFKALTLKPGLCLWPPRVTWVNPSSLPHAHPRLNVSGLHPFIRFFAPFTHNWSLTLPHSGSP